MMNSYTHRSEKALLVGGCPHRDPQLDSVQRERDFDALSPKYNSQR